MKAIVCDDYGPIENLRFAERETPVPGKGQLRVRNHAIGVNFPDGLLVQGLYQARPETPFVPGCEFAGVVEELGPGTTGFAVGDRVACYTPNCGAWAEQVVLYANCALRIPDNMPFADAACILCAHGTAHHALRQRAKLQAGESLLVLGAAGGTGLAAVQIGKAMGARVIAACSSAEKLAIAKANGADDLINYSEQDLKTALKELTGGKGVDVVYDPVGGDAFDVATRCMARNGRLLVVGFASGQIPKFPVNLALVKEYAVLGVFWGSFVVHEPKVFASNMVELFNWYEQGKVRLVLDEQLPLADAVPALQKVMNRQVKGKVVLLP